MCVIAWVHECVCAAVCFGGGGMWRTCTGVSAWLIPWSICLSRKTTWFSRAVRSLLRINRRGMERHRSSMTFRRESWNWRIIRCLCSVCIFPGVRKRVGVGEKEKEYDKHGCERAPGMESSGDAPWNQERCCAWRDIYITFLIIHVVVTNDNKKITKVDSLISFSLFLCFFFVYFL